MNKLKQKSSLSFLTWGLIPLIVLLILFRISKTAGILGMLAYLVLIFVYNINLFYQIKGQTEYSKGNLQMAEKWFKKAAESGKANADVLVNYGFILFKEGKLKEAEEAFSKAMQKSKNQDEKNRVKSNLALVIWKKGELDKAFGMLKEVIAEYKTTAVYGSLGYLAIEKGDLDEALKINLEAYDYNSDNAIILDNLAHLYHLRGEMDKAGEMFEKLMEKKPHFPEAYYDYGKYLEDAGELDKAREMYEKALKCTFNFNNTITREQVQKELDRVNEKLKGN
ncbi:tetratricopeptide repeat protein [Thermoclostridium stercorarium]|uniref:tetratricopeptide repeat protein n=1 Tax=Thermoclostridium stercorarium TaxID=1510 RepID=UPI002093377C|nr:tetratricopeptide repeat protein [Thermoclostridium stercorarium]